MKDSRLSRDFRWSLHYWLSSPSPNTYLGSSLAGCFSQLPWAAGLALPHFGTPSAGAAFGFVSGFHTCQQNQGQWQNSCLTPCLSSQYLGIYQDRGQFITWSFKTVLIFSILTPKSISRHSINCPVTPISRIIYPNCLWCAKQNALQYPL